MLRKAMQNQKVLLVGLGESGLACARWAISQGAQLTIVDTRETPPGLAQLRQGQAAASDGSQETQGEPFKLVHSVDQLTWPYDRVCISPGLAPHHSVVAAIVQAAQQSNAYVECELDWFADALAVLGETEQYQPKVIGITGTNGKTTTVSMVGCLLRQSGFTVACAGNISPSLLEALRAALQDNSLPQYWVIELSSFQLHWVTRLKFDVATVLNLSEDHLDWHQGFENYSKAKARIYLNSTICVVNRDDNQASTFLVPSNSVVHSFGLGQPTELAQAGLVRDGGLAWLAMTDLPVQPVGRSRRAVEPIEVSAKLLMPADALLVSGQHNVANALAALSLCRALGVPMAGLLHGLRQYKGEPHRVQWVRNLEDVDYIDDSKGTNVGATVAALNGLQRKTVLIVGGQGKDQDFKPLVEPVRQYCNSVVLMGEAAPELNALFQGFVPTRLVQNMQEAVNVSQELAEPGDCVLLSPACASFDQFDSYIDRAHHFVQAVQELALQGGQVC